MKINESAIENPNEYRRMKVSCWVYKLCHETIYKSILSFESRFDIQEWILTS